MIHCKAPLREAVQCFSTECRTTNGGPEGAETPLALRENTHFIEKVSKPCGRGADYVKIQSMLSKDLTHRKKFDDGVFDKEGKILTIKRPYKDEYERLKKLDLDDQAHFDFLDMCKKYKVKPMTTIFSRSRLKFLEKYN